MSAQTKTCEGCGKEFPRKPRWSTHEWERRRVCTLRCLKDVWPVTRVIAGDHLLDRRGYIKVYCPMHPSSFGTYVYLHRLIMERKIGRLLTSAEIVHHINEDPTDNRPENLQITDHAGHRRLHARFTDEEIGRMLVSGETWVSITKRGISSHTVMRVRKQLRVDGVLT